MSSARSARTSRNRPNKGLPLATNPDPRRASVCAGVPSNGRPGLRFHSRLLLSRTGRRRGAPIAPPALFPRKPERDRRMRVRRSPSRHARSSPPATSGGAHSPLSLPTPSLLRRAPAPFVTQAGARPSCHPGRSGAEIRGPGGHGPCQSAPALLGPGSSPISANLSWFEPLIELRFSSSWRFCEGV